MLKGISQYSGWLRQLRILHWLNNLRHRKLLSGNKDIYASFGIRRSVLSSIDSRKIRKHVDLHDPSLHDKLPESSVGIAKLDGNATQQMSQWDELGYIQLKAHFKPELIQKVNDAIDNGLQKGHVHYNYTGRKIFNAQQQLSTLKSITEDQRIIDLLINLFQRKPLHFQTINFLTGSEQQAHSDSIHMTTLPLGYLIGVWVALEDIHPGNGPLTYYPGSHKLPYMFNDDYGNNSNSFLLDGQANAKFEKKIQQVIAESGIEEKQLSAKAGDVFIWHANLIHGGAAITQKGATRKSMVSHYFAEGVLCFHEISERPAIIKG